MRAAQCAITTDYIVSKSLIMLSFSLRVKYCVALIIGNLLNSSFHVCKTNSNTLQANRQAVAKVREANTTPSYPKCYTHIVRVCKAETAVPEIAPANQKQDHEAIVDRER
jgi:uncharacterized membrane protein YciS (DUF1049 family)